jgi:MFS family permease
MDSCDEKVRAPGQRSSKLKIALRALRSRNYRLFFAGQFVSLTGTWMQMIAQSWLVYRLTGSSFILGAVGFASQIPILLFAFIGGNVADRYNRHRLVIATQVAAMAIAFILAALTLVDAVRIWHIFGLAVLMGMVNAFDMPARQAFIVEIVDKDDLMNAIALNSTIFNGARVVGPAVAGIVIAGVGEGWCFFANGVSYLAVIAGLLFMRMRPRKIEGGARFTLNSLLDGFRYVRENRTIRAVLLLLGVMSMAGMPYSVLMPVYADSILHGGPRGLGILMGATGAGALFGALYLAVKQNTRGLGKIIAFSCAGFGVALLFFAVSRLFWVSVLILVPVGYFFMIHLASGNTLMQLMVPDRLRGRVMALHVSLMMGMAPFGSLLAGYIAEHFGAPSALMIGAWVCVAASGYFAYRLPGLQFK